MTKYIGINDLKEGWLYKLDSKKTCCGIWFKQRNGFIVKKVRFGQDYLSTDLHCDTSSEFGIAKPIEVLEKSPFTIKDLMFKTDGVEIYQPKEPDIIEYLKESLNYWSTSEDDVK